MNLQDWDLAEDTEINPVSNTTDSISGSSQAQGLLARHLSAFMCTHALPLWGFLITHYVTELDRKSINHAIIFLNNIVAVALWK